jgi:hypothetical protein
MDWLNQERLTVYPRIFVVLYIILGCALIIVPGLWGAGHTDLMGRPLGADFSHFWLASSLSLAGNPATVYHTDDFIKAQEVAFAPAKYPVPWFYPPTFLVLLLPLATLPYLAALCAWLAVTLSGYLLVVRRIAPHPLTIWLALAFPATFQNFFHGQNGFLSAALIGGGLLLLDGQPLIGGALLGLMSYKPHLMPLIILALVAGRYWQALTALLASTAGLALLSLMIFDVNVWIGFWRNISLPMKLIEQGVIPADKMVTFFSAALLSGASLSVAWALQISIMLGVAIAVFWVWYRGNSPAIRAAVLVLGILLFTPYAFVYDFTLLALPLAWLGWEVYRTDWRPMEQDMLCLIWTLPILTPAFMMLKFQIGPLILMILLVLTLKRADQESADILPYSLAAIGQLIRLTGDRSSSPPKIPTEV